MIQISNTLKTKINLVGTMIFQVVHDIFVFAFTVFFSVMS